ncbi:MAG: DMT family transporter [Thalassovita sp.]
MKDNSRGIAWALLAALLFAVVAAMAKLALRDFHILQILFFRQAVVFLCALPALTLARPFRLRSQHLGLHCVRLIASFVALSCGIWAVAVLPLTTAITLSFSHVFLGALLAMWVLKEPVDSHRIAAVLIGFTGVVVVMRPGLDHAVLAYSLIPILGALGAAVAKISVRKLSQTDTTATLLVYQSLFVGLLSGVPLFWLWQAPNVSDALFLSLIGLVATAGQWAGIQALRYGEASVVGVIDYTKLIYAAGIGYLIFAETPDGFTLVGAVGIVGSSLYIFGREARRRVS